MEDAYQGGNGSTGESVVALSSLPANPRFSQLENALNPSPKYSSKGEDVLRFERFYSRPGVNPLDEIEYEKGPIAFPRGKDIHGNIEIWTLNEAEFPRTFSQNARNITAGMYFYKDGVPETGSETKYSQAVSRIAGHFRKFGEEQEYFRNRDEANAFEAEYAFLVSHQMLAPNSPFWFNGGISPAYGKSEEKQGMYCWDLEQGKVVPSKDSLARPQGSACFILEIKDDLLGKNGIMDGMQTETRLFKYGSGSGGNYSKIRAVGERLGSGGIASGLMSFLMPFDRNAGAIKSGGATRRAAKMVVADVDHPEIEDFIRWKWESEKKVAAMAAAGYPIDYRGEAYLTVSGQNSNNSVSVPDEFMKAVESDGDWHLTARTTGEVVKTVKARKLFRLIAEATVGSGDPGLQFNTTLNRWNPVLPLGRIEATNPCAEFNYRDNSACNLASINLLRYMRPYAPDIEFEKKQAERRIEISPGLDNLVQIHPANKDVKFDLKGYLHTIRTSITAQEILVDLGSYPRDDIAETSHNERPLGLGYANLGALLMVAGVPYNSDEGRTISAALTAILTGEGYAQSARIAARKGPFPAWGKVKDRFMEVMEMHQKFANTLEERCEKIGLPALGKAAVDAWKRALELGKAYGYRNSQATNIAPTGTIGIEMDCETTGVEPSLALVTNKELAGGGNMKIVNRSVGWALRNLGYDENQIKEVEAYITGHGRIDQDVKEELLQLGFTEEEIQTANTRLEKEFKLPNQSKEHPVTTEKLFEKGASRDLVSKLKHYVEGESTIEGAPHVKKIHYPIFDCANPAGSGKRYIHANGHIDIIGDNGIGPFLSGSASKTVNLPADATVEDIEEAYMRAWKSGVKVIAIYPEGSKTSQPLMAAARKDLEPVLEWGVKSELPIIRTGLNLELRINGEKGKQKVYVTVGEYANGKVGEIFCSTLKEGSPFKAALNAFAIEASDAFQHGRPLESFVKKYLFVEADPKGPVENHPYIQVCTSVYDAIAKAVGMEYLGLEAFEEKFGPVEGMGIRPRPDPSKLRVTQIQEWNRFNRFMRIVRGDNVKEATREARATAKKKGSRNIFHIKEEGAATHILGGICSVCGGMTKKTGPCETCQKCGASSGCG